MEEALSSRQHYKPNHVDSFFFKSSLIFDGLSLIYVLSQLVFVTFATISCIYRCETLLFPIFFHTGWRVNLFDITLMGATTSLCALCTYKTVFFLQQQWSATSGKSYLTFILLDAAQFIVRLTILPTLKPVLSPVGPEYKDEVLGYIWYFTGMEYHALFALIFAIVLFSVELSCLVLYWVYAAPMFRDGYEPLAQCDPLDLDVAQHILSPAGQLENAYRLQGHVNHNTSSNSAGNRLVDSESFPGETMPAASEASEWTPQESQETSTVLTVPHIRQRQTRNQGLDEEIAIRSSDGPEGGSHFLWDQDHTPVETLSEWPVGFSEYHSTWDPETNTAAMVILFMVFGGAVSFTIDTAVKLDTVLSMQQSPKYWTLLR